MSFHVDFIASSPEAVESILPEEHLPDCVRDFIIQALKGCAGSPVSVKAVGHLYNGDYQVSSASIEVRKVNMRTPKVEKE
jgi:hypothetical protein